MSMNTCRHTYSYFSEDSVHNGSSQVWRLILYTPLSSYILCVCLVARVECRLLLVGFKAVRIGAFLNRLVTFLTKVLL